MPISVLLSIGSNQTVCLAFSNQAAIADICPDPVLLCNDLGAKREAARSGANNPGAMIPSDGHHSMSVKEAVQIAQSNNFMGLVCSSRLLVSLQCPATHVAVLVTTCECIR